MSSKQKQRTKGNTRPSSSGRAAELLARDGSSAAGASGFIGFGTMSGDLGYVPAAQSLSLESDQDSSLEADFRLALRKLTKRDVVTKLKAIQEFGALCKEKNAEAVKGTLPHWPRIYSRLATDHDKRVREAAQQAFEQLILRIRRNLAPQLRALMGTWLLSQCDTYAPAALSARAAFHSAFPATKQGEAIAFCKMEVLRYLEDNFFKETAASLSDPKSYTPEEQEEKYLRILTSSLLALGEFVTVLPEKEMPSVQETLSSILAEGKLWKLAKSKSPQLRSAMYSLQGSLIKNAPSIAEAQLARISTTLLGGLDESDPLAVQALWESVLLLVSTYSNCWAHLNVRKAVLPKLWSMLRQGGNGSATVIYPSLLPLLSHVPLDVIGTGVGFYREFFDNIKEGFTCSSALQSTSEYGAIVKAYMECLRYATSQSVTSDRTGDSQSVQIYLIQDELMLLLEQSITHDDSHLAATSLYLQTSKVLSHLHKLLNKTPTARNVLNMFWMSLEGICTKEVQPAEATKKPGQSLEKISVLLTQLQSPDRLLRAKMLKKRTVSFSDDGPCLPAEVEPRPYPTASTEHPELIHLVRKLVRSSYGLARNGLLSHLKFLVRMLNAFPRAEMFEELLDESKMDVSSTQGGTEDIEVATERNDQDEKDEVDQSETSHEDKVKLASSESENVFDTKDSSTILQRCFDDVLLPWIQAEEAEQHLEDAAPKPMEEVLKHAVCIVAAAFGCCEQNQRQSMLDAFCQETSQPQTLYILIKKILDSSYSACARVWLKSDVFGEKLLKLADTLCSQALDGNADGSASQSWDLINLGLSVEVEEPTVNAGYAERILCKFTDTLQKSKVKVEGHEQRVLSCINFICDVATNFFSAVKGCLLISSAEDLLLALFQLGCKEATNFPESVQQKIQSAWTKGAESLIRQTGGYLKEEGFLCKVASWIKACVNQGPHSMHSIKLLAKPALLLSDLISSSLPPSSDPDEPGVAESFLGLLMPTESEWDESMDMPNQWMLSLFLDETLTFTSLPELTSADPVTMPTGLVQSLFVATLVRPSETLISPEVDSKPFLEAVGLTEQDKEEIDRCVAMTQLPWRYDAIAPAVKRLLYALQWCKGTMGVEITAHEILPQNLSVASPSYALEVAMVINTTLEGIWKCLSSDDWKKLVCDVLEMSMVAGYLWSSSISYLLRCYSKYQGKQEKLDILEMAQGSDRFAILSLSSIHTLEAILPHLSKDQTMELIEINTAKLLSSNEDMVTHIDGGVGSIAVVAAIVRQPDGFDAGNQSHVVASCVQQLMQWRREYPDIFFFECDFRNTLVFDDVYLNIKMMQLIRLAIEKLPTALSEPTWDFVLCSLVAWIQTCSQNIEYALSSPLVTMFSCAVFDLLTSAVTLLGSPAGHSSLPANLCTEWREFYSDSVFSLMLPLFVTIVEATDFDCLTIPRHHLLQSVSDAVRYTLPEQLKKHTLLPKSPPSVGAVKQPDMLQASAIPQTSQNAIRILLDHLCPMLLRTNRSAKMAAFQLLEKVMNEIARTDEELLKDEPNNKDQREEESSIPPPEPLKEILDSASAYMEVVLADVQVGECLTLDPTSTGYHQSLSSVLTYLLVWRLYLRIFKAASAEVRAEYANYLRQTDGVASLMMNIFRLMPDPPVTGSAGGTNTKGSPPRNMFSIAPTMKAKGISSSQEETQHQACALYYSTLEDLPAMVRQWWTSQDKKIAPIIDRFTTKYASPLLSAQEVLDVQTATQTFENMTVKARSATREVIATYTMQDLSMDLTVRIPANHPLGIITVDSEKKVGVGTTQWRNWTLQLTTFLRNQNGSIMDGLTLWKRNVDKRFEGLDDCMICFSVIHGSNCSLPKLQCKTCKKRYHSACLYKWFSTSNQSSCPLCRSPF